MSGTGYLTYLPGVTREVVERSKDALAQLEEEHHDAAGRSKIAPRREEPKATRLQPTLFGPAGHPMLDELRRLAPIETLQRLKQWQETQGEEWD